MRSNQGARREMRDARFKRCAAGGRLLFVLLMLCVSTCPCFSIGVKKKAKPDQDSLTAYLARARGMKGVAPTNGGLWTPDSPYTDIGGDYKARRTNDIITIQVVESTSATEDGAVKSARTLSANSSITGLLGTPHQSSALQNLFSPNSSRTLNGQAQTSANSSLSTSLSGRVVEALPNGYLVVEAQRQIMMNNQHQTVIIHGVVRPADITSTNTVLSTAISNLEVELKGRGVISDGTAPPNSLVRMILKVVGF